MCVCDVSFLINSSAKPQSVKEERISTHEILVCLLRWNQPQFSRITCYEKIDHLVILDLKREWNCSREYIRWCTLTCTRGMQITSKAPITYYYASSFLNRIQARISWASFTVTVVKSRYSHSRCIYRYV